MAAPVAHIWLALVVLAGPLHNKFEQAPFIVGTSFPDIRYLKCVQREETHRKNVTWQAIAQEEDAFRAGVLFHCFVDEVREKYIVKNKIYEKLPSFKFISQTLKIAEDEWLRSTIQTHSYSSYFDTIFEGERLYGISDENIEQWHTFLREYCDNSFSHYSLVMKYLELNKSTRWYLTKVAGAFICKMAIKKIVSNKEVKALMLDFYLNFLQHLPL